MTIEIVSAENKMVAGFNIWLCRLDITQGGPTYTIPATAPGELAKADLQAYFDADETGLWTIAEAKGKAPDVFGLPELERVLKAFALVVLDEINILRQQHGLAMRDESQIRGAIKNKLQGF